MTRSNTTVRIRPDLVPRLRALAERERRPLNAMANLLIEDQLDALERVEREREARA